MSKPIVLFDMDGVLINASASYTVAILKTTHALCAQQGIEPPPEWLDGSWLMELKQLSGFNNDWVASETLALLTMAAHDRALSAQASLMCVAVELKLPADSALWRPTLKKMMPAAPAFNEVKRIFQSAYLGEELLAALHPNFEFERGIVERPLISVETLLVSPETLAALSERARLGIATGRPRAEAEWALSHHKIAEYFGAVVTHDDAVEEAARRSGGASLLKPSPWPLLESARRLGGPDETAHCYFGDLPDDMAAANSAGFRGIGIVSDNSTASSLRDAGAARVFERSQDAMEFVLAELKN